VKSYAPSGNGEGPLATVKSWVNAGYETNTMPGWAGSSWYFLRYIDPKNKKAFANESELDYWFGKNGGVNMYVGGSEHATGHLLYSRFWHKLLKDLGYVKAEEPFQTLRNQGLIMGPDGRKMSKRWGNVINPDDVVRDMGADTMRVYEAFMGPFESSQPWSTDGIVGSRRFIERVWNIQSKVNDAKTSSELEKVLHKTIKKVTDDIANFSFNTAVSSMMICINEIDKLGSISKDDFKKFLQILAPFAPHMTDELWASLGEKKSIHISTWPTYNAKKIIDETITMGIQVNGKVRGEITLTLDESVENVKAKVLAMPEIIKWIEGNELKKFIYIPGKVISIVI
jgi:leucyl-tRNA synthetase